MRGLCRSHHSQRTARETRFGRAGLEVVALLYGVEHRPGTLYSGLEISQLTLGVFDLLSRYRKLLLGAEGISEDLFVIRGHERSICPAPALGPGDGRRQRRARAKSLPVDRARLRAGGYAEDVRAFGVESGSTTQSSPGSRWLRPAMCGRVREEPQPINPAPTEQHTCLSTASVESEASHLCSCTSEGTPLRAWGPATNDFRDLMAAVSWPG